MQIAMLPQMVALLMLTLWGLTVLQGVLGKRQVAAWLGMATAVLAVLPFAPRVMHYLFDSEGFVTRYGGAAINEVIMGGVFLALALAALLATPFVASRAWGWLLPALASLPPVAFYVWLVFFFRIIF
jgi:hypothetical protein